MNTVVATLTIMVLVATASAYALVYELLRLTEEGLAAWL